MHRFTMLLMTVLALFCFSSAHGSSLGEPYAIWIRNLQTLRESEPRVARFAADVLQDTEWQTQVDKRQQTLLERPDQWRDPDGFEPFVGRLYFITDEGKIRYCGIRTVANFECFEAHIESEKTRRGDDTIVEGGPHKFKITNPAPVDTPPGEPIVRWHDSFLHYDNGIVFYGNPLAFDAAATSVSRALKGAKSKDSFLLVQPQEVNKRLRENLLRILSASKQVDMQRRDGESDSPFLARREVGQNFLDAFNAALFETKSVTAWEIMPSKDRPYQASVSVVPVKGSTLDEFTRQLKSRAPSATEMIDRRLLSASVSAGLPDVVIPSAKALLRNSDLGHTVLGKVIEQTIEDQRIDLVSTLDFQEDSSFLFSASAGVSRSDVSGEELARCFPNASAQDADTCAISLNSKFAGEIHSAELHLKLVNNRLAAVLGPTKSKAASPFPASQNGAGSAISAGILLSLNIDLSSAFADDDTDRRAWRRLEEIHQKWCFYSISAVQRRHFFRNVPPPLSGFRSLVDKAPADGDWTLTAGIHAHRGGISVRCKIGRELYYLAKSRQLVSAISVSNMIHE